MVNGSNLKEDEWYLHRVSNLNFSHVRLNAVISLWCESEKMPGLNIEVWCAFFFILWSIVNPPVCEWIFGKHFWRSLPQTKSCSSFPEWLRLSFRPDRIFWAGEVSFWSLGRLFGEWQRAWPCPALGPLLDWFVFGSAPHLSPASSEDPCVEPTLSMSCTTSNEFCGSFPVLSAMTLAWWCWRGFKSNCWGSLWLPGSGEELRLLSALPGWSVNGPHGCRAA